MAVLKVGNSVRMKSGGDAKVISELGAGGQGTVYKVSYNGKEYALKWYHKDIFNGLEHAFYLNLQENIKKGAPTNEFLWPIEVTEVFQGQFGYIMDIRPQGYHELTEFFCGGAGKKQVHFKSFVAQADAAINIIKAFRTLHNSGYAYQDINNGNFFINPENGKVLICDNDNVAPEGNNLGIGGKQRYMAPEVVMGGKPDTDSDRFSLSVILFRLLCINHPLEGRRSTPPCMTKDLEKKYYGEDPTFVLDPTDDSNRPVPGLDSNLKLFWPIYPNYIKEMFIKAFSKDVMHLRAPRIIEKDWFDAFIKYKASIIKCPCCGEETFAYNQGTNKCIDCKQSFDIQNAIKFNSTTLPLYNGAHILLGNVDSWQTNIDEEIGIVITNPNDKNLLGIKNTSKFIWNVSLPSGTRKPVEPNSVVPIKTGFEINFINNEKESGTII